MVSPNPPSPLLLCPARTIQDAARTTRDSHPACTYRVDNTKFIAAHANGIQIGDLSRCGVDLIFVCYFSPQPNQEIGSSPAPRPLAGFSCHILLKNIHHRLSFRFFVGQCCSVCRNVCEHRGERVFLDLPIGGRKSICILWEFRSTIRIIQSTKRCGSIALRAGLPFGRVAPPAGWRLF